MVQGHGGAAPFFQSFFFFFSFLPICVGNCILSIRDDLTGYASSQIMWLNLGSKTLGELQQDASGSELLLGQLEYLHCQLEDIFWGSS